MDWMPIAKLIKAFAIGYPFVMAWYWMAGGLLHRWLCERHEPLADDPPVLPEYPPVSILLPCHNEEAQAEETLGVLAEIEYPDFEIIAINDGSTDRTAEILDALALRIPQLRVVHLAQNQGKSTAMNVGALLARSEILVGTDGDAMLDRHSLTWFVRRFQCDARLGGVTGNPRIRNRASILGQLQVGEFSSIIGLIKRAQTVYGRLFTVSGVKCAFRKRALQDIGWWSRETLTDDVDVSWRVQLGGWRLVYEPKAICWILMPETLKGLWHQRLRWSIGGTQAVLDATRPMFFGGKWRLLAIWLNYVASIAWAYSVCIGLLVWLVKVTLMPPHVPTLFPDAISGLAGALMVMTYLLQAGVSVALDSRFERGVHRALFWVVWYPLVFWMLQAFTAAVALPKTLLRPRGQSGTWISPDRGLR
ncbi:MAG TPA: poly-beta-1,6-N-acetyl-D-glucosamine synthase [Chthoniobacter sp.]|nr:poly-beta-1,6-N-acetyl-D-glucosamine synthase [Chthoniobacter sp.]